MNIFKRPTTHYGKAPQPETPATPAWPWLLALALVLSVPALRLAGPASLAAALAP